MRMVIWFAVGVSFGFGLQLLAKMACDAFHLALVGLYIPPLTQPPPVDAVGL